MKKILAAVAAFAFVAAAPAFANEPAKKVEEKVEKVDDKADVKVEKAAAKAAVKVEKAADKAAEKVEKAAEKKQ